MKLLVLTCLLLTGCGTGQQVLPVNHPLSASVEKFPVTNYLYDSDLECMCLKVYSLGEPNAPIRVIPLISPGGISVDENGNVYIANGSNVTEFDSGANNRIQVYTARIHDAVNVAVGAESVYVADQIDRPQFSQIIVFGHNARTISLEQGYPHAMTVDGSGDFFFEESGIPEVAPPACTQAVNVDYEIPAGKLQVQFIGVFDEQNWGLASVDNVLYSSDECLGPVRGWFPPSFHQSVPVGNFGPGLGYMTSFKQNLVIPQTKTGDIIIYPLDSTSVDEIIHVGGHPIGAAIGQ